MEMLVDCLTHPPRAPRWCWEWGVIKGVGRLEVAVSGAAWSDIPLLWEGERL